MISMIGGIRFIYHPSRHVTWYGIFRIKRCSDEMGQRIALTFEASRGLEKLVCTHGTFPDATTDLTLDRVDEGRGTDDTTRNEPICRIRRCIRRR